MFDRSPLESVETRRVLTFLAFAFGIAWAVGGAIALTGGLSGSPVLLSGTPVTLATALLATGYMWAPAAANVLTRALTGEGRADLLVRPRFRDGWPYWLAAWVLPAVLTLVGVGVYFLLFPRTFDPTLGDTLARLEAQYGPLPVGARGFVALQVLQAVVLAPPINAAFTFGEEFGWRAYLLPKLLPLGERRATLLTGVVWGVWHWPVIVMGYNYGLDYPGAPWLGLLAMVWFAVVAGTFLAWVTLRGRSVWPAVVGHAAINGVGAVGLLFVAGSPNLLLGPAVTGVVASAAWALLALALLRCPGALAVSPGWPGDPD